MIKVKMINNKNKKIKGSLLKIINLIKSIMKIKINKNKNKINNNTKVLKIITILIIKNKSIIIIKSNLLVRLIVTHHIIIKKI